MNLTYLAWRRCLSQEPCTLRAPVGTMQTFPAQCDSRSSSSAAHSKGRAATGPARVGNKATNESFTRRERCPRGFRIQAGSVSTALGQERWHNVPCVPQSTSTIQSTFTSTCSEVGPAPEIRRQGPLGPELLWRHKLGTALCQRHVLCNSLWSFKY